MRGSGDFSKTAEKGCCDLGEVKSTPRATISSGDEGGDVKLRTHAALLDGFVEDIIP
jgi:hypothetical protein